MEKEIISRENIKPSSPTPPHLKTHNLSLLDLLEPPIYVPMILYFPADPHNSSSSISNNDEFISQKSQTLKKSLSSTLTRYYPLAGILSNNGKSVDCNDEGVPFIVSRMKCDLLEFTANKNRLHDLNLSFASPGSNVTRIHVNFFDCGGMVITSLFLHTVTDGVTMGTFLKAWGASSAREEDGNGNGNNSTVPLSPIYNAATLFPHNEAMHMEPNIGSAMCSYLKMGKIMRRPYVFTSSAISTLRTKLMEGGSPLGFRPSRVEIVSAFIWKCFIIATSSTSACRRPVSTNNTMAHTVNLRRKADPPIPEHSFGNHCWYAPASTNQTTDVDLKDLVLKMRNSLSKIDSDFVRRMEAGTGEGFSGYSRNLQEFLKEFPHDNNNAGEFLLYSSWCNFGLYDIDFGWGKPIWVTGTNANEDKETLSMNSVLLIDTKERDGIEAWVCIDERYFEAFDRVDELQQALAALDPLPQQNVAY